MLRKLFQKYFSERERKLILELDKYKKKSEECYNKYEAANLDIINLVIKDKSLVSPSKKVFEYLERTFRVLNNSEDTNLEIPMRQVIIGKIKGGSHIYYEWKMPLIDNDWRMKERLHHLGMYRDSIKSKEI